MSRAKEAALKAYPIHFTNMYMPDGFIVKIDINTEPRKLYQRAYEQAEKDFALTKDDVWRIFNLVRELQTKYPATEGCLQEVADIFNEQRKK